MAIDTERKRKSIAAISSPWNGIVVVPDGTISGTDKQTIGYSYAGISAGSPPAGGGFSTLFLESDLGNAILRKVR